LPINQNQALFSLLGTTYGGDGRVNFALPNLQGRVANRFGQGPGLADYTLGQISGSESVTLSLNEMLAHTHPIVMTDLKPNARCRNQPADQHTPVGNVPAVETKASTAVYSSAAPDSVMSGSALVVGGTVTATAAGGGQPHPNVQPYLVINCCIALQGLFPSRS